MNPAQLHLLLNHIPILGTAFSIVLLLVGIFKHSEELKRVSLWAFVVLALFALPVFFTGQPAEKVIEGLPGVSEQFIAPHEDFAKLSLFGIEILGLLCLVGWLAFRRSQALPSWLIATAFILALVVGGMMVWTGHLGGMIRHTEIRSGFQPQDEERKSEIPKDTTQVKPDVD